VWEVRCVSSVEVLSFLKKSLGIIIKRLEEEGVITLPVFSDHQFIPEIDVSDAGVELNLPGLVYKVKNIGDVPFYLNIGRPVTDTEYTVVFPGSYHIIPRSSGRVFLKAPRGYTARARVEVLK
jgi:hypothetical protein